MAFVKTLDNTTLNIKNVIKDEKQMKLITDTTAMLSTSLSKRIPEQGFSNWAIRRNDGKFTAYVCHGFHQVWSWYKMFGLEIPLTLPKEVTAFDELFVPWDEIEKAFPLVVDALCSPTKDMIIIQLPDRISFRKLVNGKIGSEVLSLPVPKDTKIIMAQWATYDYIEKWTDALKQYFNGDYLAPYPLGSYNGKWISEYSTEDIQLEIKNAYYDKFEFRITLQDGENIKFEKGIATKTSEGYFDHMVQSEDGSFQKKLSFIFNSDGSITFVPHEPSVFSNPVTFMIRQREQLNFQSGVEGTEKVVKISPEEALELLVKSHGSDDTRPDKGYSYDGIDTETGYYMFSWANPGKGTGAFFEVDPYTGDVYDFMGQKTGNLLESEEEKR
ncbi:MAG TPA: hypothetical protein GXX49_11040 [Clostridiaceae bacterium]|nr:hypothetical protein [Clostridiaceae bacterium]